MALSDADVHRAEANMQARLHSGRRAISARYDRGVRRVVIELDNGWMLAFPAALVEDLRGAAPEDLAAIEITPSGLGLHFPRVDADLYLPALLNGVFGSRDEHLDQSRRQP